MSKKSNPSPHNSSREIALYFMSGLLTAALTLYGVYRLYLRPYLKGYA